MKYRLLKRYKYELSETLFVSIPELSCYSFSHEYFSLSNGELIIQKGYVWDGPSGPTIDTRNSLEPSLVHDALYQSMRARYIPQEERKTVDKIFRRQLLAKGMSKFRATYFYYGVRLFGKWPASKSRTEFVNIIYEA